MSLREQLLASVYAERQRAALSNTVKQARRYHHMAIWARRMAVSFPHASEFYHASAARSSAEARTFMASAREMRTEA